MLFGTKEVFKYQDLQRLSLTLNKYIVHPLEVVGRGSETQL